ncbi:glycosyltransferase family 4 protein, partial [uncultured Gordonia sp.]
MKIGMICPYSFDVPGGVQAHVVELAEVFGRRGHEVSVLAPAADTTDLPDYVVSVGPALAIPYNGSVSRVNFSPRGYMRLRRWIADNEFDVLHVHEPNSPSTSMLALMVASGPIVT